MRERKSYCTNEASCLNQTLIFRFYHPSLFFSVKVTHDVIMEVLNDQDAGDAYKQIVKEIKTAVDKVVNCPGSSGRNIANSNQSIDSSQTPKNKK